MNAGSHRDWRVRFGKSAREDRKGIVGSIRQAGKPHRSVRDDGNRTLRELKRSLQSPRGMWIRIGPKGATRIRSVIEAIVTNASSAALSMSVCECGFPRSGSDHPSGRHLPRYFDSKEDGMVIYECLPLTPTGFTPMDQSCRVVFCFESRKEIRCDVGLQSRPQEAPWNLKHSLDY